MPANIAQMSTKEYLCARLIGTPQSWHAYETEHKTLGDMWNATMGHVSYEKKPVSSDGIVIPNRYALHSIFSDGTRAVAGELCAPGYTLQSMSALYDLISKVNEAYRADYLAVLSDGFIFTASFDIGEFTTADNSRHFSRFLVKTRADKKGADLFNLSHVRVVCANTLAVAETSGINQSLRHARGIDDRASAMVGGIHAAQAAQLEYKEFYNQLLHLSAPKADDFYNAVFGLVDPSAKRDTRTKQIEQFDNALMATAKQSPELENTAQLWLQATTHNQKTIRTRVTGRASATEINAAKAIMGENDATVELAVEFFRNALANKPLQISTAGMQTIYA